MPVVISVGWRQMVVPEEFVEVGVDDSAEPAEHPERDPGAA
ncbi:MAG: hypothetical protein ACRDZ8_14425 [Acidimicrobiales bacterium]